MNFFSFFLIKVHSSQSLQSTGNTTQEVEIDFDNRDIRRSIEHLKCIPLGWLNPVLCVITVLLFQGGVCTCVNVFFLLQERHIVLAHTLVLCLYTWRKVSILVPPANTLVPMQYNFPTPAKRPPHQLASMGHVSCTPAEPPALVLCLLCILQKQNCCTLISILCTQCIPLSCITSLYICITRFPSSQKAAVIHLMCFLPSEKSLYYYSTIL